MFRFSFSLPLLASLGLLNACNSIDPVSTTLITGSTDAPAEVTALCSESVVIRSRTLDYGSTRHPFAISVPKGSTCRFTLTVDPDHPRPLSTTLITFDTQGIHGTRLSTKSASLDLGNIPTHHQKSITVELKNGDAALLEEPQAYCQTRPNTPGVL